MTPTGLDPTNGLTTADQPSPTIGFDPAAEFDRQLQNLLAKDYPELAGMSEQSFSDLVEPLRAEAVRLAATMSPPSRSRVPFVIVIDKKLAPANDAMTRTALRGKPGFSIFDAEDIAAFEPIKEVSPPPVEAYLVLDVYREPETRNLPPERALPYITGQGRTPITVEEGIAFITQFPDALEKNNCFSVVASRRQDRRVPALWISKAAPKLGWCFAGAPHTWLGSASCGGRVG